MITPDALIYKYRSIDQGINLIERSEIYMAKPQKFNDPFDSYVEVDLTGTKDEWRSYFKDQKFSDERIEQLLRRYKDGRITGNNTDNSVIASTPSILRLSCYTKDPKNILMWSHYAQNHNGICVGFRAYREYGTTCLHFKPADVDLYADGIPLGVVPLVGLDYSKDMPKPNNRLKDPPEQLIDFCTTKSLDWEYEQEYRVLLHETLVKNNPVRFDPYEIFCVIFGIKTTDEDRSNVMNAISKLPDNGDWIEIGNCKRVDHKYEIEIV